MGKKSKRQPESQSFAHPTIYNKTIIKIVDELWSKTHGNPPPSSVAAQLEEYEAITERVNVLIEKQGPPLLAHPPRQEGIAAFERWLGENGAEHSKVELTQFPGIGYGLKAKVELEEAEKVMTIPDKLMMTTETAAQAELREFILNDRVLQQLPNVVLSLHLLMEACNQDSFWKPYIDVLPSSFTTPLYFTRDDLLQLQSSPALAESLAQKRNILKLYTHLHRLIRSQDNEAPSALCANGFFYLDFIWAVSCVMSRQNQIPSSSGKDFDIENHSCICYAGRKTGGGTEFTIFYGARPNSDLLLHQGFVYPENSHDFLKIKLGLSSGEEPITKTLRSQLLVKVGQPISGQYYILKKENPFGPELMMFGRLFTADYAQLQEYATLDDTALRSKLSAESLTKEDLKLLDFLGKRCQLLLHSYKTTLEDAMMLLKGELPACAREAVKLRLCEKQILQCAAQYALTAQQLCAN
ncbi:hypothetical protein EMCRGX_G032352 [Ephydatia muelleri]